MPIATVDTLRGILKDMWSPYQPRDSYDRASPVWTMMAKTASWKGGTFVATTGSKELLYNFGLKSSLPAAGDSTYEDSYQNPGATSNDEVKMTLDRYYTTMKLNHDVMDAGLAPEAYMEPYALESEGHVKRTNNVCSNELWGNGGGVVGKLDGLAGAVLNNVGNTTPLSFLNNMSVVLNIAKGDRLQFSATDGTTGTVKSVVKIVQSTNPSAGTVTLTTDLLAGDGVLDNDFVFHAGRFGKAFKGIFAWCPRAAASLSSNFFNLDQTDGKRGGHRVRFAAGDPYAELLALLRRADEVSADVDMIVVRPTFLERLMNASQFINLIVERPSSRNPIEQMMKLNGYGDGERERDAIDNQRFGVDGICIRYPRSHKDVYVYGDRFLNDHTVSSAKDDTVVALNSDNLVMPVLAKNGFGWQDQDGLGAVRQETGKDNIAAVHAVRGQIGYWDPNDLLVGGSNVTQ